MQQERASVLLNFCVNLTRLRDAQVADTTLRLGVSVKGFPERLAH